MITISTVIPITSMPEGKIPARFFLMMPLAWKHRLIMPSLNLYQSGSAAEAPFEPEAGASRPVAGEGCQKGAQIETGASPHVDPKSRDQIVAGRLGEQLDEVAMNIMIYEHFYELAE